LRRRLQSQFPGSGIWPKLPFLEPAHAINPISLPFPGADRAILQNMPQAATTAPSPGSPTFAGLLAALAAPSPAPAERPNAWGEDGLADDVATLSYERALRAHARYRPPEPGFPVVAKTVDQESARICAALPDEKPEATQEEPAQNAVPASAFAGRQSPTSVFSAPDRNLKNASVTIRMSKAECAQLHRRAAEAGLTVSAYLRSCTFEAESLRAMVKETLAQLRTMHPEAKPSAASPPSRRGWREWLTQHWSHARTRRTVARA